MRRFCLIVFLLMLPTPGWARTHTPTTSANLVTLLTGGALGGFTLQPGDIIQLQCGTTYTGPFDTAISGTAGNVIIMEPSCPIPTALDMLNSANHAPYRASFAGQPVLQDTGATSAVIFAIWKNTDHWLIRGIEFSATKTTRDGANTVAVYCGTQSDHSNQATTFADLNDDITFDRNYFHGTTVGDTSFGIRCEGTNIQITNNYLTEFHGGNESKCIYVLSGSGPYTITNNYCAASAVGIMFGGGCPAVPTSVPSDIDFERNYFTKLLKWKSDDPSYAGINWEVKNIFELKNAQRVTVRKNIFENSWNHAQSGYLVLFTPAVDTGGAGCATVTVSNVTMEDNVIRNGNGGFQFYGLAVAGPSVRTSNIRICNNLWYGIADDNWKVGGGNGSVGIISQSAAGLTFCHNTVDNLLSGTGFSLNSYDATEICSWCEWVAHYMQMRTMVQQDNFWRGSFNVAFAVGDNTGSNKDAWDKYATFGYTVNTNVVASDTGQSNPPLANETLSTATWQALFTNVATRDYRLASATYKAGGAKAASDGTDMGVNNWCALPSGPWNPQCAANAKVRLPFRAERKTPSHLLIAARGHGQDVEAGGPIVGVATERSIGANRPKRERRLLEGCEHALRLDVSMQFFEDHDGRAGLIEQPRGTAKYAGFGAFDIDLQQIGVAHKVVQATQRDRPSVGLVDGRHRVIGGRVECDHAVRVPQRAAVQREGAAHAVAGALEIAPQRGVGFKRMNEPRQGAQQHRVTPEIRADVDHRIGFPNQRTEDLLNVHLVRRGIEEQLHFLPAGAREIDIERRQAFHADAVGLQLRRDGFDRPHQPRAAAMALHFMSQTPAIRRDAEGLQFHASPSFRETRDTSTIASTDLSAKHR